MRILLATDNFYPVANGVAYFTERLAHGLVEAGHEVLVIAPAEEFKTTRTDFEGIPVVGIRSVPLLFYKGFRFSPPAFIRGAITEALTDFRPDVVHIQSHFFVSRAVGEVAQSLGIPTVGTNHFMPENLMHYVPFGSLAEPVLRWLGWEQFLAVYRTLDAVATPTRTAAELIQSIGFERPVEVISCGIDLDRFQPARRARKSTEVPRFLFVGRLDADKHLDLLIRAVARARRSQPLELVLAGKGVERPALEALAAELGIADFVTFTGYVPDDDLSGLYQSVDCFVIPSTVELQSIVTLEAMASGLPIIAANAIALPELVTPNVNGELFPPNDEAILAKALVTMAADPKRRQAFGAASRQRVAAHAIQKTIDAYIAFYKKAVQSASH